MTARILAAFCGVAMVVASAAAVQPETTAKVFQLRFASPVDVSAAVLPLLSKTGSLTIQPGLDRVTVQDQPAVMAEVVRVISDLDRAPMVYRIQVDLLEGSRGHAFSSAEVQVNDRVRQFGFESYRRLGTTAFEGEIGSEVSGKLGDRYRVSFLPEPIDTPYGIPDAGSRLHIRGLLLERLPDASSTTGKAIEIVRTNASLSVNQEFVLGAAGSENASTGLVLILRAEKIERR
jgi:hypothetical protein